jgi:hypothetical protein
LRLHLLIRNAQLGFQQLLNDERLEFTEPNREKPCLLGNEPLPQLLISAVSESAYEVRNVIVLLELRPILRRHHGSCALLGTYLSLNRDPMLPGHLLNLLSHRLLIGIRIEPILWVNEKYLHKLDLLEDLKAVEGELLELMKTDDVLRRLIIHVDLVVRVGGHRTSSTIHDQGLARH